MTAYTDCPTRGDRLPRRAAADHCLRGFGQDAGHLATHRAHPGAAGRRAPQHRRLHLHREGGGGAQRQDPTRSSTKNGVVSSGMAEMYIGTMHGYCLDLLQRLVPETFKFSVLTEITARLLVDRNSRKSGLTVCPTSSPGTRHCGATSTQGSSCRRLSVLREDASTETLSRKVFGIVVQRLYRSCCTRMPYFDFTEMINLAVQLLEGDPSRTKTRAVVQAHIRDDIRYVVVDEYQDVNPLQERLVAGWSSSAPTSVSLETTTRRSTSGGVARSRTSSRSPTATPAYDRSHWPRTSAPARASSKSADQSRSGFRPPNRLPKAMVRAGHQSWERGDLIASRFRRRATKRRRGSATASRRCAGLPSRTPPRAEPRGLSWSDFAVLFRSVANDAGPARRGDAAPRTFPYVVKGLNRLFDSPEIQAVVGIFRYMAGEYPAADLRALWDGREPRSPRRRWARRRRACSTRAATSIAVSVGASTTSSALYLEFLEALGSAGGDRSRATRRSARARLLPARQVQPGDLRLRGRSTSTPSRRRSTSLRQMARAPGAGLLRGV